MPALRERVEQDSFQEGMVRVGDRATLSKAATWELRNALLDDSGDPYRRGGNAHKTAEGLPGSTMDWAWDGRFVAGARTLLANFTAPYFAVLEGDDETGIVVGEAEINSIEQSAQLKDILFIGGGFLYAGSRIAGPYSTGTVKVVKGSTQVVGTGTEFEGNVDEGALFRVESDRVYVVAAVSSNTELVLAEDYVGANAEGKGYSTRAIVQTSETTPYKSFSFLTECAGRIVGAEGNKIYFTEVNNPHTYTNSLGTENVHELPAGVEVLGLSTIGDVVLVFTTKGLWLLEGLALAIVDQNGNSQHRLQSFMPDFLLKNAAGVAHWEGRLVVPSDSGVWLVDDTGAPDRISGQIQDLYLQRLEEGYGVGGAVVDGTHYLLPIVSGGTVKEVLVCRLDLRSKHGPAWTLLDGYGADIKWYVVRGPAFAGGESLLFGAQASAAMLSDCSSYFTPDNTFASDADESSHKCRVIFRDFDTGVNTKNMVRQLRAQYEMSGEECTVKVYWSKDSTGPGDATDEEGAVYHVSGSTGGESIGNEPVHFRINKLMRKGRFMLQTEGAVSSFVLRRMELRIRPSGATRK